MKFLDIFRFISPNSVLFYFIDFFSNFLSMVTIILKFFFSTKIKTILLQTFSFIPFLYEVFDGS